MKRNIGLGCIMLGSLWIAACGGSDEAKSPTGGASTRQTLSASGDCSFEACGAMPSSLSEASKVECSARAADSCGWSEDPADSSVSYRQCAETECPAKPAVECPADTVQSSQACGSENDGPCAWTTVCVPPRITTPCPRANGCDGQAVPAIGIICQDGSAGGMTCVTDGETCFMERDCD